jgi:hypothetical protein
LRAALRTLLRATARIAAAHIYRHEDSGHWSFEAIDGLDAALSLKSVGIEIPLAEIHEFVALTGEGESQASRPS